MQGGDTVRSLLKSAFCILISFLLCISFIYSAQANSAIKSWSGIPGYVISPGEQCPIILEHELLTVRIDTFPAPYAGDADADVTAQYTLTNPTNEEIRVRLMFPVGQVPDYGDNSGKYGVTVNGAPVKMTRRFSFPTYSRFDTQKELLKLQDAPAEDGFWKTDLPVTIYTFTVTDLPENAKIELNYAGSYPAFLFPDVNREIYWSEKPNDSTLLFRGVDVFHAAVFGGEAEELACSFTDGESGLSLKDVQWSQTEKQAYTLRSFLAAYASAGSPVSDTDRFNAAVWWLKNYTGDTPEGALLYSDSFPFLYDGEYMEWYEYTLSFSPGETLVNTVSAPFYPDVDARYIPAKYTYNYLLSPAAGWADFGGLDVEIITPFYLLDASLSGFTKTDNGWTLHTDGLPEEELRFTLSEAQKPKRDPQDLRREALIGAASVIGILFILACIAGTLLLITKILRKRIRKKRSDINNA